MTINTNHSPALVAVDPRPRLWANWMALRNGDLSLVEEVVAPNLLVHLSPGRVRSRSGCTGGRGSSVGLRAATPLIPGARLTVAVGPIIGPDLVAGRWTCPGIRRPDQVPDDGPAGPEARSGVDIIRIDGDRIVECWSHDDVHAAVERPVACAAA